MLAPDRLFTRRAGHPPGYLLQRASGEVKAILQSTATPLGITADGRFPASPAICLGA